MGHVAFAAPPSPSPRPDTRFVSLGWTPESHVARRSSTLTISIVVHAVLLTAGIVVPLLYEEAGPEPTAAIRAFFVEPATVAAPPPPPPPPAPGPRPTTTKPPAPVQEAKFVAPVDVPPDLPAPDESFDAFGVEGGVAGGVEGGVPGGVVGGVVGGIPTTAPAPPRVRVGGMLVAPKILKKVPPVYPDLAKTARVGGIVIMEAVVGVDGRVADVKVLRGHPLLDQAAVEAVRQWRYQPLLLNGVPNEFILSVTVVFNMNTGGAS